MTVGSNHHQWLSLYQDAHQSFFSASSRVFEKQNEILHHYLKQNQDTVFGKRHGFHQMSTYAEFARNVPLRRYEDFEAYITPIGRGENNILTAEDVVCFEETSGTDSHIKKIPYTQNFFAEFDRAIGVWLYSISRDYPQAFKGDMYLSISPPLKKASEHFSSEIQIGIGDDLSYFNQAVRPHLSRAIVSVPCDQDADPDTFYDRTIERLLASSLSFVSVWSPTFLLNLDKKLQSYLMKTGRGPGSFVWKDVFPSLTLLSCWTDGQAALWTEQVRRRLGDVEVQGKGLLSTEGIVSIPVCKGEDPLLAFCSHFFEFRDHKGYVYPAYDLKEGETYEVILTTAGGLYRYLTGDTVRITGFHGDIPTMRFIGRSGRVSDLAGEKLTEYHVNQAFDKAREIFFSDDLIFLYPLEACRYTLFMGGRWLDHDPHKVVGVVDEHLRLNPYYDQARCLGQLKVLDVQFLPGNFEQRLIEFLCDKFNIREGVLKLSSLYRLGELGTLLAGNGGNMEAAHMIGELA